MCNRDHTVLYCIFYHGTNNLEIVPGALWDIRISLNLAVEGGVLGWSMRWALLDINAFCILTRFGLTRYRIPRVHLRPILSLGSHKSLLKLVRCTNSR